MSEMIERVARAIWEAESLRATGRPRSTTWEDAGDEWKSRYHPIARAAIEAMRAPSDAMVKLGTYNLEACRMDECSEAAEHTWEAMIDAALRQEPTD